MRKVFNGFCVFGVLALSLLIVPKSLPAADLTASQQAVLAASLAANNSYAAIIKQAKEAGMACDAVVFFLCQKAGSDNAAVYDIVYAAITAGCEAQAVVDGALRAKAPLNLVIRAAKNAGAKRKTYEEAVFKNGYSAGQLASAMTTPQTGGQGSLPGGGSSSAIGGGSPLGSTGPVGGGAGGGTASPIQP